MKCILPTRGAESHIRFVYAESFVWAHEHMNINVSAETRICLRFARHSSALFSHRWRWSRVSVSSMNRRGVLYMIHLVLCSWVAVVVTKLALCWWETHARLLLTLTVSLIGNFDKLFIVLSNRRRMHTSFGSEQPPEAHLRSHNPRSTTSWFICIDTACGDFGTTTRSDR